MHLGTVLCITLCMIVALTNGLIGLGLGLLIGSRLGLDLGDTIYFVLVSTLAGLVALTTTLQAEKNVWLKKFLLNRSLKTWALLLLIYFGSLLIFCPQLREGQTFLLMAIPLVLTTGFSILLFGPIQDRIVSRSQRNSR